MGRWVTGDETGGGFRPFRLDSADLTSDSFEGVLERAADNEAFRAPFHVNAKAPHLVAAKEIDALDVDNGAAVDAQE